MRHEIGSGQISKGHAAQLRMNQRWLWAGCAAGMTYLRQAVALDPNYALAYSTIAYNYGVIEDWYAPPREVMPEAEAAAKKAFELDPTLGNTEGWLAYTDHFYNYDQAKALQEFQHAVELDPNDAEIHAMYGWCLADLKRYDEGVEQNVESLRLDPISAELNHVLGQTDYYAHRYDDAIQQERKTIQQFSSTGFVSIAGDVLGWSYAAKGQLDEAIRAIQQARKAEPDFTEGLTHSCGVGASITNAPTFADSSIALTAGSGAGFGRIGISIGATLAGCSCLCPSFTASTSLFGCST